MISVAEALQVVLSEVRVLGSERIALPQALGRVLAQPVQATRDVPPFRNAAMDGYAVQTADISDAASEAPVVLRILETVGAGKISRHSVTSGTAIKIMTGSPMPDGADAVVRLEDTQEQDGTVRILARGDRDAHVRHPGEDMRMGDLVLTGARALRPADIGLLASLGIAVVPVQRRPTVAILSTGDELVDLGQPLAPGQIVDSNAYTLAAAVQEAGAIPRVLGIVSDTPEAARQAFTDAFTADLVLSSGGVSMGMFDLVREILAELGSVERFWQVAQRPGRPLSFGMRNGTPVFGLPGYPVSALVCFYVYVRPVLRAMQGLVQLHLPVMPATAAESVRTVEGLTQFVRCVLVGEPGAYRARTTGPQGSGILRSLSLGNALLISPPETGVIEPGSAVRVMLLSGESVATPPV